VEDEGPVDETGVDPKDIELVIQQVGCSRAKAVKVLKESGGDLINASTYFLSLLHIYELRSLYSHGSERVIGPSFPCTSIYRCIHTFKNHLAEHTQCILECYLRASATAGIDRNALSSRWISLIANV
jgi:hypothetical protein